MCSSGRYSCRFASGLVASLVAVVLLFIVPSAFAQGVTYPGAGEAYNASPEVRQAVVEWLQSQSPAFNGPSQFIDTDLYNALRAGQASTAGAEVASETVAADVSAGILPELPAAGASGLATLDLIPPVGAAVAAFGVGALIGSAVNSEFLHIGMDEVGPPLTTEVNDARLVWCSSSSCGATGNGASLSVPGPAYQLRVQFADGVWATGWGDPVGAGPFSCTHAAGVLGTGMVVTHGTVELWCGTSGTEYYAVGETTAAPIAGLDYPEMCSDAGCTDHPTPAVSLTAPPLGDAADAAVQQDVGAALAAHPEVATYVDGVYDGLSATVPDCDGLSVADCEAALDAAGFATYHVVVLDDEGAVLSKPAGAIVATKPATGTDADTSTDVEIDVNPDPLPVVIPAPAAHETYADYLARVQALGLVGRVVTLTDATSDPHYGPNEVVTVSPAPGTRVQLADAPEVVIRANPETAPEASTPETGAGGVPLPTVPAIDLDPLKVPAGSKFPFGVPGWVAGALGGFGGDGHCPQWNFPVVFTDQELPIDLCVAQPVVDAVRPVLLLASIVVLGWMFMAAAMGFGNGGGGDE